MITKENFLEKLSEVDARICALKKIKETSNNPDGFNALITDLEKKRTILLKLKL